MSHIESNPANPGASGGVHSAFDWSERYQRGDTPWDLGGPHPELLALLREPQGFAADPRGPTLVPGAGRGHDALALAQAGHQVVAVDLAPEAAAISRPGLERLGGRSVTSDALAFAETGFAAVFEHTFLCALDPSQRAQWAALMRRALLPGGQLVALVFPVDRPLEEGGPPHRIDPELITNLLGSHFRCREDRPVANPGAGRRWQERLMRFEKR